MKHPDWRSRLYKYLAESARAPFVPGTHDCALFAAGAVEAMTGTDYAADYRGAYDTLANGIRVLRKAGIQDHVDLVSRHFEEIAPLYANVGDIAAVPGGDQGLTVLGIVTGPRIAVLHPNGLGHVPLTAASRAFRV